MAVGESVFSGTHWDTGRPPSCIQPCQVWGSVWWTKYFLRTYGIEIENNSESKKSSAIGDFSKNSEIENNLEFKESSALEDSSKDSTEGSS